MCTITSTNHRTVMKYTEEGWIARQVGNSSLRVAQRKKDERQVFFAGTNGETSGHKFIFAGKRCEMELVIAGSNW